MDKVEDEILALFSDPVTGINAGLEPGDPRIIKAFYAGKAVIVNKSNLPALMVYGTASSRRAHGTARDQVTYQLTVRVVVDQVASFTVEGVDGIIKSQRAVRLIMEELNDDGIATSNSVLGILRRNIKGTNYLYSLNQAVTYDDPENNRFSQIAAECKIEEATRLVLRQ